MHVCTLFSSFFFIDVRRALLMSLLLPAPLLLLPWDQNGTVLDAHAPLRL